MKHLYRILWVVTLVLGVYATLAFVALVAPSPATAVPGMQDIGQLLVKSIASGSANTFLTLRAG